MLRTTSYFYNPDNTRRSELAVDNVAHTYQATCNWTGSDPESGYDPDGNLLVTRTVTGTATDGMTDVAACSGGTTQRVMSMGYDARNFMTSATQTVRSPQTNTDVTRTQSFDYFNDAQWKTATHDGRTTTYSYDPSGSGRRTTILDWRNRTSSATYPPSGAPRIESLGGVASSAVNYLPDGSISSLVWTRASDGASPRSHTGMVYDVGGLRTSESVSVIQPPNATSKSTGGAATFSYDLLDRLKGWHSPFSTVNTTYDLDDGGNIEHEAGETTVDSTYTNGQLTKQGGVTFTYNALAEAVRRLGHDLRPRRPRGHQAGGDRTDGHVPLRLDGPAHRPQRGNEHHSVLLLGVGRGPGRGDRRNGRHQGPLPGRRGPERLRAGVLGHPGNRDGGVVVAAGRRDRQHRDPGRRHGGGHRAEGLRPVRPERRQGHGHQGRVPRSRRPRWASRGTSLTPPRARSYSGHGSTTPRPNASPRRTRSSPGRWTSSSPPSACSCASTATTGGRTSSATSWDCRAMRPPTSAGSRRPPSGNGPAEREVAYAPSWPSTAASSTTRPRAASTDGFETAARLGWVNAGNLLFAPGAAVDEMERLHDLGSLRRGHPDYRAPAAVVDAVRELLASGRFRVLAEDATNEPVTLDRAQRG